jgi:hypothetical protein
MFPYFLFCKTSVSFPGTDSVTRFPDLSLLDFENSCPIFLVSPCIPFFLTTFPISSHGFLVSASPYDLISFPLYFAVARFCLSVFYYISSPSPNVSCFCCHHSYSWKFIKLLSHFLSCLHWSSNRYLCDPFFCIVSCWPLYSLPIDLQFLLPNPLYYSVPSFLFVDHTVHHFM